MLKMKWIRVFMVVGLVLLLHGFGETSTQRMIHANDHNGLAN